MVVSRWTCSLLLEEKTVWISDSHRRCEPISEMAAWIVPQNESLSGRHFRNRGAGVHFSPAGSRLALDSHGLTVGAEMGATLADHDALNERSTTHTCFPLAAIYRQMVLLRACASLCIAIVAECGAAPANGLF